MKHLWLLCVLLLAACQTTQVQIAPPTQDLWQDQVFNPTQLAIESPEQIFYLPAEVVEQAQQQVSAKKHPRERSIALLRFIFRDAKNPLSYVNSATLTAEQTYQQREANCLSLTILSYSLAEQLGFKAQFRDVKIPEYWITRNGTSFLNGHVNLQVTPPNIQTGDAIYISGEQNFTIDFELEGDRDYFPVKRLTRDDIVALFYNNKAADALFAGQHDVAYQYLRAAAAKSPNLAVTWNNLAILYRKKALLVPAELAYQRSLMLEPNHSNTLANLALLYQASGRMAEATALELRIKRLRDNNPYYYLMLGNEALYAGALDDAYHAYQQSLRLKSRNVEVYQGLAQIALQRRDWSQAIEYLEKARRQANNPLDADRFQGKIAHLTHALANLP